MIKNPGSDDALPPWRWTGRNNMGLTEAQLQEKVVYYRQIIKNMDEGGHEDSSKRYRANRAIKLAKSEIKRRLMAKDTTLPPKFIKEYLGVELYGFQQMILNDRFNTDFRSKFLRDKILLERFMRNLTILEKILKGEEVILIFGTQKQAKTTFDELAGLFNCRPPIINQSDKFIYDILIKAVGPLTRPEILQVMKEGLPRSTVFDALARLMKMGYVRRIAEDRRVRGQPKAFFEAIPR